MASVKAKIAENVQRYLGKADWKNAITEMEKLYAVDEDPIVRVRIGDVRQKLGQKAEAVREYIHAADLYAERGFVVKALAQYKLALRMDPANKDAPLLPTRPLQMMRGLMPRLSRLSAA